MTKLADILRALAERAPVDDASVTATLAARRIKRGRRARIAANTTAALGVAAVIALAVIHPDAVAGVAALGDHGSAQDSSADRYPAMADSGASAALGPQAVCGTPLSAGPDPTTWTVPSDQTIPGATVPGLTLNSPTPGADPGAVLTLEVASTGSPDVAGQWEGDVTAWVMWNGYVVATTQGNPWADTDAGTISLALVNCWDGAALPAGNYDVLVTGHYAHSDSDVTDPAPVEPAAIGSGILAPAVVGSASDSATRSESEPAPAATVVYVVSNPIELVISGEGPDDPFANYLHDDRDPGGTASTVLSPQMARDSYARGITSEPWTMTPGTQRVVLGYDSRADGLWTSNTYFGCSWTSDSGSRFPAESATWPILEVTTVLPRQIEVSYGWVVDGNPRVDVTVTNTSSTTIANIWHEPDTSLVLVKDGVAVAEASLVNTTAPTAMAGFAPFTSLGSHENISGTYLWRDIVGCTPSAGRDGIQAGTYTVLHRQSIDVDDSGYIVNAAAEPVPVTGDWGNASSAASSSKVVTSAPMTLAPDMVSFAVYTSLGTITIT